MTLTKYSKILFLDLDGVMITRDDDGDLEEFFNSKCVRNLNSIIKQTNAQIILSSDWRGHYSLSAIKDIFKDEGIIKGPVDYTPDLWTKNSNINDLEEIRSQEIKKWLRENKCRTYCVIDDMKLNLTKFVQIDPNKGLTLWDVRKVIKFLS
jgi:hypothetical protein